MMVNHAGLEPCLIVGIEGLVLTDSDYQRLQHEWVAGVILFSRNYQNLSQLAQLCESIRQVHHNRQWVICVDHEGGRVQRFQDNFFALPTPASYLEKYPLTQAVKQIRQDSLHAATELRAVGIDVNFAPCVDLEWGRSQVLASRCYSSVAKQVIECARAFIQGHQEADVKTVLKHFPGHGYVMADSHIALPQDERSLEELTADLLPYRELCAKVSGVMMAHIVFPNIDSEMASYSAFWIKQVLREQMQFTGKVYSDDLQMLATVSVGTAKDRILKALAAGNDWLIWGNDLELLDQQLAEL